MNFKLLLPLIALMGATRIHHFGSTSFLPDASLAVFFLAGLFFTQRSLFVALLIEAGLLDYVAITQFNVSDFCISFAYVFLIPTYFTLWFAGRFCANFKSMQDDELTLSVSTMGTLLIAITGAFLISNGSFYLLSKNVTVDFTTYVTQTVNYYPHYVGYTLMYSILGFASFKAMQSLSSFTFKKA